MVGELLPELIDPVRADRAFWARYHELDRLRHLELWPDDPMTPDEIVEAELKKDNPFELHDRYEISRDGVMLSTFHTETVSPASPEYETNKHLMWLDLYVRPDARRHGIAKLWLPLVLEVMDRHGPTVVGMWAQQEPGHSFIKWLDAEPKLTSIESRLKLSEVDWAMVERWCAEGQERSPHTRLDIYDGPLPDAILEDYAPQLTSLLNTMPFEGLDIGKIAVTPAIIREWDERMALGGEVLHTVMTHEADGVLSGITDVGWAPYRRTLLFQRFTGVRPDARGRGLGKWIKAAMLLHMRKLYSDLEWVATDNAHSNGPMLKINRTLGFKPHRTEVTYQMTRDQLESRIRSL